jgi:RecA/RadA recombinase
VRNSPNTQQATSNNASQRFVSKEPNESAAAMNPYRSLPTKQRNQQSGASHPPLNQHRPRPSSSPKEHGTSISSVAASHFDTEATTTMNALSNPYARHSSQPRPVSNESSNRDSNNNNNNIMSTVSLPVPPSLQAPFHHSTTTMTPFAPPQQQRQQQTVRYPLVTASRTNLVTTTTTAVAKTKNPYSYQRNSTDQHPKQQRRRLSYSGALPQQRPYPPPSLPPQAVPSTSTNNNNIHPQTALQLLQSERAQTATDPLYLLSVPSSTVRQSAPTPSWLQLPAGIHELAGPGGTGKTQMALTLCLQAAASASWNSSISSRSVVSNSIDRNNDNNNSMMRAIYISLSRTNVTKVAQRLQQMAAASCATIASSERTSTCQDTLMNRIGTKCCATTDDLWELLQTTLPAILQQQPAVRLVVLDSIADLFRHDFDNQNDNAARRAALLFRLTAKLQALVTTTKQNRPLSILVLNQVTADFTTSTTTPTSQTPAAAWREDDRHDTLWTPALGLSWSHCMHSRFQLHRRESTTSNGTSTTVFVRRIRLAHSARHPPSSAFFTIAAAGCQLLDDSETVNGKR